MKHRVCLWACLSKLINYFFTQLLLAPMSWSSLPASGLNKQETLSVIRALFLCLNECLKTEGEHTPWSLWKYTYCNTRNRKRGTSWRRGRRRTDGARGNGADNKRGSEFHFLVVHSEPPLSSRLISNQWHISIYLYICFFFFIDIVIKFLKSDPTSCTCTTLSQYRKTQDCIFSVLLTDPPIHRFTDWLIDWFIYRPHFQYSQVKKIKQKINVVA